MTIGVPKETVVGERRVALTPDSVALLAKKQLTTVVESGAGAQAYFDDEAYIAAGAYVGTRVEVLRADMVACVHAPSGADRTLLKSGTVLVGLLKPLERPKAMAHLADRGVTALAMELIPRISRAQVMDALSAMASLGGYKAVLMAASRLPRFFPLLTTAAGTVRPANVMVLGAGVAGLQAIATARRLGARVWGYDIRKAVREEVHSLGARFVDLDLSLEDMQDAAGYARALMDAKARHQADLLVSHLAKSDVVITTAQIPGRAAPLLVQDSAVKAMKAGSVIVDLAASTGGNCALTEADTIIVRHGVTIMGPTNVPATMPSDASYLYGRTVSAAIREFVRADRFVPDFDDEIFRGICVTHEGRVVSEHVNKLLDV